MLLWAGLFSVGTLSASDGHTGLWHLVDNKHGNTVCFMVNAGADSWRVYSGDWGPLKAPEVAENGSFRAELPFGRRSSVSVHVAGGFQEGRLAGTWQIKHLQFQESGTWKGFRISTDPEWKPWGVFLRKREKVVNVTERLSGGVPFSAPSDFKKSWQKLVEADYYAALTSTLFVTPSGRFTRSFRDEQLRLIFDGMSQDSGVISSARSVETVAKAVHDDLKKLYPWYKIDATILVLPTGESFDFRYFRVGGADRSFFLISADWVAGLPEAQLKILVAQGLLYAALREDKAFPVTTPSELALRGIVAHLSQKLKYAQSPYDLLFIEKGEEELLAAGFDDFRQTLLEKSSTPLQVSFSAFLKGEARSRSYYFGYQFGHRLFETFRVKEVLDINVGEKFISQLNNFLADESITPVPLSEIGNWELTNRP